MKAHFGRHPKIITDVKFGMGPESKEHWSSNIQPVHTGDPTPVMLLSVLRGFQSSGQNYPQRAPAVTRHHCIRSTHGRTGAKDVMMELRRGRIDKQRSGTEEETQSQSRPLVSGASVGGLPD